MALSGQERSAMKEIRQFDITIRRGDQFEAFCHLGPEDPDLILQWLISQEQSEGRQCTLRTDGQFVPMDSDLPFLYPVIEQSYREADEMDRRISRLARLCDRGPLSPPSPASARISARAQATMYPKEVA